MVFCAFQFWGSIGIDAAVLATRCDDFLQASGDSASQAVFTGIAQCYWGWLSVFPKGTGTMIPFYIYVELNVTLISSYICVELNMPNVARYKGYCERHR